MNFFLGPVPRYGCYAFRNYVWGHENDSLITTITPKYVDCRRSQLLLLSPQLYFRLILTSTYLWYYYYLSSPSCLPVRNCPLKLCHSLRIFLLSKWSPSEVTRWSIFWTNELACCSIRKDMSPLNKSLFDYSHVLIILRKEWVYTAWNCPRV